MKSSHQRGVPSSSRLKFRHLVKGDGQARSSSPTLTFWAAFHSYESSVPYLLKRVPIPLT